MHVIKIKEVAKRCGDVSIQTIYRWQKDPKVGFPKSFELGGGTVWDADEIDAYIKQQKEKHHGSTSTDQAEDADR